MYISGSAQRRSEITDVGLRYTSPFEKESSVIKLVARIPLHQSRFHNLILEILKTPPILKIRCADGRWDYWQWPIFKEIASFLGHTPFTFLACHGSYTH